LSTNHAKIWFGYAVDFVLCNILCSNTSSLDWNFLLGDMLHNTDAQENRLFAQDKDIQQIF
jgi:hypothetical protein